MSAEKQTRYVISVVVPDRVAILRDITTAITDLDANIDGISQTVVAGYFTALLTATFEGCPSADAIKAAIQEYILHSWSLVKIGTTAAQKKQQDRMRDCNAKAEGKSGDERKKFMSSCLKG